MNISETSLIPKVLAIGASDTSSGAGIQVDIFTLTSLKVFPYCVITALTAQNSGGILEVYPASKEIVAKQLEAIYADTDINLVKIGVLANRGVAESISNFFEKKGERNLIVDPIFVSSTGTILLSPMGFHIMEIRLLPLAKVVTPNLREAERMTDLKIESVSTMKRAARMIHKMGPEWTLIKGGHLKGEKSIDVLYNGKKYYIFESQKIPKRNVRGTGCLFASALSSYLALGASVPEATKLAKTLTTAKIKRAVRLGHLGRGRQQALPFQT